MCVQAEWPRREGRARVLVRHLDPVDACDAAASLEGDGYDVAVCADPPGAHCALVAGADIVLTTFRPVIRRLAAVP